MKSVNYEDLILILQKAMKKQDRMVRLMNRYEKLIGENQIECSDQKVIFLLEELASFVPYYTEDSVALREEYKLFDRSKMKSLIQETLSQLRDYGLKMNDD